MRYFAMFVYRSLPFYLSERPPSTFQNGVRLGLACVAGGFCFGWRGGGGGGDGTVAGGWRAGCTSRDTHPMIPRSVGMSAGEMFCAVALSIKWLKLP